MLYGKPVVQKDMREMVTRSTRELEMIDGCHVLVTGANGMIAHYFVCMLMHANLVSGTNIRVSALVRNGARARELFSAFIDHPLFNLIVQDVCTPINVENKVDYIIHAASSASPKWIKNDPVGIIRANTLGAMNTCELARSNPGSRLLLTSTREVYGRVDGKNLLDESCMGATDPLEPRSCYPESKRIAEQICCSYGVQYGMDYVIARIAHVYGPGMDIGNDGRVMSDFVSDAVNRRDIVLNSAGDAERAFCYLQDAVCALVSILVTGSSGEAYNVANELEPITVLRLAEKLADLSPHDIGVAFAKDVDRSGYCSYERVALDCSKLELLGWRPVINLDEGLMRTLESFGG